jgi:hypothetical protein
MKKLVFIIFFIWCALSTQVLFARADTTTNTSTAPQETAAQVCDITSDDLSVIQAIQNNSSLSYYDELQQELTARKQLLTKIISCAKTEAEDRETVLNAAPVDPGFQTIQAQWLDKLNEAVAYYDLQLGKINTAGISGTESIAQEVLVWRENNYAPLAENVSNFIIWSENQTLFTAAESRLAQIKNLVNSPLFSENLDVQNDFNEAAVSLTAAENENVSAKSAFAQSLSPDQPLLFIGQSLNNLSSTYQHFFDVSNLIQSLLPQ